MTLMEMAKEEWRKEVERTKKRGADERIMQALKNGMLAGFFLGSVFGFTFGVIWMCFA